MTWLILGLVLFVGVHSASMISRPWRNGIVERFGEGAWKGAYSVIALLGLVLIVVGYSAARSEPTLLYTPTKGLRHAALLLMLPVFPLLIAVYLNGHLKARAKHPMLLATKLWALAHLLANGTLADVVLFGSILAWAVTNRISVARRERLARATSPTGQGAAPHNAPQGAFDAVAIVLGLALYAWFVVQLHARLFGVAPVALSAR
jgi:uncharacterized membrane protein